MFTENFFKNVTEKMTKDRIDAESLAVELALTEEIKKGKVRIEVECEQLNGESGYNYLVPRWSYHARVSYPGHDAETKSLREKLLIIDREISKHQDLHREDVDKIFALNSEIEKLKKELRAEREVVDLLADHKAQPIISMAKAQVNKREIKL